MSSIAMNLIYCLCAGLASALVILWFHCKLKHSYWKSLKIKYLQPVPLFGNLTKSMLLLESYQETYQELYIALGNDPYAGYYEMNIPILIIKDPELITAILVKDFKHFQNRGRPFPFIESRKLNPLSLHVGVARDDRWKFLRHRISPVFTAGKIKQMQEKLTDTIYIVHDYVDELMNGQDSVDVDLCKLFEQLTMHVITYYAFGTECNFITSSDEFQQMMSESFRPKLSKTWNKLLHAYCPSWLNDILNRAEVDDNVLGYFRSLALGSVEYRRAHGTRGNDILQAMMDLQNSHADPKFAVSENSDTTSPNEKLTKLTSWQIYSYFYSVVLKSTSTALSFCIYELALNEKIQRNSRLEVQKVEDECGELNYESFRKMSYLDAVMAETHRKYPVPVTVSRECTEDYVIPGTDICLPRGTNIKIPTWSIHHDWRYYPNPEKFDPRRFIGYNKNSIPNGAYLAFGNGPRSCMGKRFAEVEMKAAVAHMMLKYEIKLAVKTEIPIKFKKGCTILRPENTIWVNVTRIKT